MPACRSSRISSRCPRTLGATVRWRMCWGATSRSSPPLPIRHGADMAYSKAVAISAAGMAAEKARIEAATLNLANMNTSAAPGAQVYRPVTAIIRSVPTRFTQMMNTHTQPMMIAKAELIPQTGVLTRAAYGPGHPEADANRIGTYPAVDPTQEMMTVMTALRAYEANLAALEATRSLGAKALEI